MRTFFSIVGLTCLLTAANAQPAASGYRKIQLSDKFYAEGAYFADFNKDGKMDVVAGPWWFEGPAFTTKHEYRPVNEFQPTGYSDNFLTYAADINGDGWCDIVCVPWPGKEGFWYENPQGKDGPWKQRSYGKMIGGESPVWADVDGDGRPDLVHNINGEYGYSKFDPAKPDAPWTFVSICKGKYSQYSHGQGAGDVNGDGKVDLLESGCWWEQPAKAGEPWKQHVYKFAAGGAAQLLVADVDGDGLNDVITAVACHGYGLVWHKQIKDEKGEVTFKENVILPAKPDTKSQDLRISQLHALDYYVLDGKFAGFVTGKRLWAHGLKGDAEPDAPPVLYLFQLQRDKDKGASFAPVKIDDASGVGTQVAAVDLNDDKTPDIIVANKKGMFIFLSQK
jgi:hypothetical protein